MGLAIGRERGPQRLLGAGFSHRPGDADEFRRRARPSGLRQRDQTFQHIGHHQQRRVLGELIPLVGGDDREACAGLQRRLDEVMAVALVLEREERFARLDGPGVDRKSRHALRQRAVVLRTHRVDHCVRGPQGRAHVTFSCSAASASA